MADIENSNLELDNESLRIYEEFADKLIEVCPSIFSREEIINRLKENIKGNVIFGSNLDKNVNAFFDRKNQRLLLSSDIEKGKEAEYAMDQLFIALVSNIPSKEDSMKSDEPSTISAANLQLFNELMAISFHGNYRRKTSEVDISYCNYEPAYANQLGIIFGDELISTYVKSNGNLGSLSKYFHSKDGQPIDINTLISLIGKMLNIREMGNKNYVNVLNRLVELNLTHLLGTYLSLNPDLSDTEKIQRIDTFIGYQIAPNFTLLKEIIEKNIKDKSLIQNESFVGLVYTTQPNDITDSEEESHDFTCLYVKDILLKYGKFMNRDRFGYNEENYSPSSMVVIYNLERDLAYLENEQFFKALLRLDKNGNFSLDKTTINKVTAFSEGYYKVETSSGDFYLSVKDNEMKRAMALDEAMALYIEKRGEKIYVKEPDPETENILEIISYETLISSDAYKRNKKYNFGIVELDRLRNSGVTTVYVGNNGVIHEDGEIVELTDISSPEGAITSTLKKKDDKIEIPKRSVIIK